MLEITRFGPVTRLRLARRLPGLRPLWVHAFLVDGLLIDAGQPACVSELLRALAPAHVEQVVLTHHHEDHIGAAAALQEQRGLVPRIHPAGQPLVARRPRLPASERLYWGEPAPVRAEPLGDEVLTPHYRFRVLPTPGHAPDHMALYEPDQGWLFSGDLLIHPRLATLRRGEDLVAWRQSLRQLAALPAPAVFCSHYPKVLGAAVLQQKLDFWAETGEQARVLQRQGVPLPAIRDRVLGREGLTALLTGYEFAKRNLIAALLSAGEDGLQL